MHYSLKRCKKGHLKHFIIAIEAQISRNILNGSKGRDLAAIMINALILLIFSPLPAHGVLSDIGIVASARIAPKSKALEGTNGIKSGLDLTIRAGKTRSAGGLRPL